MKVVADSGESFIDWDGKSIMSTAVGLSPFTVKCVLVANFTQLNTLDGSTDDTSGSSD
jgi:hypothetical protein